MPLLSLLILTSLGSGQVDRYRDMIVSQRARETERVTSWIGKQGFKFTASDADPEDYHSRGVFFDPASGLGGIWWGGPMQLVLHFPTTLNREMVEKQLTLNTRKLFDDASGDVQLDLAGTARINAGAARGESTEWRRAVRQAQELVRVLGLATPPTLEDSEVRWNYPLTSGDPLSQRPTLPLNFRTKTISLQDLLTIAVLHKWPDYSGPTTVSKVGTGLLLRRGPYCSVTVHAWDKQGLTFGSASREFTLTCYPVPAKVGKDAALRVASEAIPDWELTWNEKWGIVAERNVSLGTGMTLAQIERVVSKCLDEVAPVCFRFYNAKDR